MFLCHSLKLTLRDIVTLDLFRCLIPTIARRYMQLLLFKFHKNIVIVENIHLTYDSVDKCLHFFFVNLLSCKLLRNNDRGQCLCPAHAEYTKKYIFQLTFYLFILAIGKSRRSHPAIDFSPFKKYITKRRGWTTRRNCAIEKRNSIKAIEIPLTLPMPKTKKMKVKSN